MSLNLLKRSILFEKFYEINVYILHGLFKFLQLIKIFYISPLLRFPFLEKKLIDSLFVKQIKLRFKKCRFLETIDTD